MRFVISLATSFCSGNQTNWLEYVKLFVEVDRESSAHELASLCFAISDSPVRLASETRYVDASSPCAKDAKALLDKLSN